MTDHKVPAHDITALYPGFYSNPQEYKTQDIRHFAQTSRILFEVKGRPEAWVQAFTLVPRADAATWPEASVVYLSFQAALDFLRHSNLPLRVLGRPVFAESLVNDGESILEWKISPSLQH